MIRSLYKLSSFAAAAAISLAASSASASTLSLTYEGASSGADRKVVTIDAAPVAYPGSGDWSKTVGAWGFKMHDSTGGLGSFIAWCLDVGSFLSTSSTDAKLYSITANPFSNSYSLTSVERGRVQSLFDANYASVDITVGNEAAGFQLALWNALYDSDNDVTMGAFAASATDAIEYLANGYLGAAGIFSGDKKYNMAFLESDNIDGGGHYQNLVTVSQVPIPAAGGLLLLALAGMGAAARRSKRT